jgi:hypothetical protein
MLEDRKHTLLKSTLDILSVLSILTMFVMLIWPYPNKCQARCGNIVVFAFLSNAIPALMGVGWLLYRYGDALFRKYPTTKNSTVLIAFGCGFGLFLALFRFLLREWVGG